MGRHIRRKHEMLSEREINGLEKQTNRTVKFECEGLNRLDEYKLLYSFIAVLGTTSAVCNGNCTKRTHCETRSISVFFLSVTHFPFLLFSTSIYTPGWNRLCWAKCLGEGGGIGSDKLKIWKIKKKMPFLPRWSSDAVMTSSGSLLGLMALVSLRTVRFYPSRNVGKIHHPFHAGCIPVTYVLAL